MPMKSFMAKEDQVEHKWLLVDADGAVLGRMASKIAMMLMGKNKPTYTPHVDTGDFVVVVNADKIRLTGTRPRRRTTTRTRAIRAATSSSATPTCMEKKPEKVLELAVRRMLPKTQMGRKALRSSRSTRPEHEHQAQQPQKVELF